MIRRKLNELGKTQLWLAEELGITPQSVCKYAIGTSIPKEDILNKLYSSLAVPYKTIDDLL